MIRGDSQHAPEQGTMRTFFGARVLAEFALLLSPTMTTLLRSRDSHVKRPWKISDFRFPISCFLLAFYFFTFYFCGEYLIHLRHYCGNQNRHLFIPIASSKTKNQTRAAFKVGAQEALQLMVSTRFGTESGED